MKFYCRITTARSAHSAQLLEHRFKLQTGTRISVSGCETVVLSCQTMLPYGFHSLTNENEKIVMDIYRLGHSL